MQPPVRPSPYSPYRPAPPPKRGPWRAIGGVCLGCVLAVLVLGLVGWYGLHQAMKSTSPPPPPAYVGAWRYTDTSTSVKFAISAEGRGYRAE